MTRKKKIILSISSILLVLVLYGWFFGFQTYMALFTRLYLNEPGCRMVPQPMEKDVRAYAIGFPMSGKSDAVGYNEYS